MTTNFLTRILDARRFSIAADRTQIPVAKLREVAASRPSTRDFEAALRADGMSIIAEFKRSSPSRGVLNADLDPAVQARAYERGGARAMSVLAEPEFFGGSASDVTQARHASALPVLWKDVVIDTYQVLQARAAVADAVLLIVRILSDDELGLLLEEVHGQKMTALVEVFNELDLKRALAAGARVIGVNHRDLETFEEDPTATARLRAHIPRELVVVGESAISARAHVKALEDIGVDSVLVGEALVRSADPAQKIRELLGRS